MSAPAQAQVDSMVTTGDKKFRGMKLHSVSFKGQDLRNADFRGASLPGADFTGADLTYANFEGANCTYANFTDAKCYRTNFKDANLSFARMHPKDLLGATITLDCKSFQGMDILPGWWYAWLFYALLMKAPSEDAKEKLIALMGVEKFQVLKQNYARRMV